MQAIKSKGSKIEVKLAKALWARGWRYRKNDKRLPGKPDLVFYKFKVAIFVDGEFFHGYNWETEKFRIKSNREFWWPKIEGNMVRDSVINNQLDALGWKVIRFWGKKIITDFDSCILEIEKSLNHPE